MRCLRLGALPLALLLSTCGSDVTADQACADFTDAVCGRLEACVAPALRAQYGDVATCRARLALSCPGALNAPQTTTTPALMDDCAHALMNLGCSDLYRRMLPAACKAPAGPFVAGAGCGDNGQCQTGYCRKSSGSDCGACATRSVAGASCSADDDCDYGLTCAKNGLCVALGTMSSSCDVNHPCEPPLTCRQGTCATAAALDAPCSTTDQDCDTLAGLYCHPGTMQGSGTCKAIAYALPGGACGAVNMTLTACTAGSACDMFQMGTCRGPAADGAACSPMLPCLAPAFCTNGQCKLPDPASCR